ncbi:MAG: hypothetical protein M1575_01655 [Patescibacteria group bacterium]|nr:hypothetical protein [Patescibacteria group bacterium]
MTIAVNKLANGTIELTITIPWSEIKSAYDLVVDDLIKETELPGFRKGKAPRNLVEEKMDKSKVYEEVLKKIVPQYYATAIKQENLAPIVSPQIEIIAAKEKTDWQFRAKTCEKPEVKLGNYQEAIASLKKEKQTKIWVSGKEEKPEKPAALTLDEIVKALLSVCQVQVPDLLIEDEVNRMLSRLVDQTQKLGLTIEQYLVSQNKTSESLREEYKFQAQQTLALEFILEAIADQEKVEVNDAEIEKIIQEVKDPREQAALKSQKYYLATILRRQKTLEKLSGSLDTASKPIV